jgi:hypothetical protein
VPRNNYSRDRLNHSRAHVVAARARVKARRFRRLKNEPLYGYYGPSLKDVTHRARWWRTADPADAYLFARVPDAPVVYLHPDFLATLPLWVRRDLYLPRLERLDQRLRYYRGVRDPWDWPVPLSVIDGYRSRERNRWRREAWDDWDNWDDGEEVVPSEGLFPGGGGNQAV